MWIVVRCVLVWILDCLLWWLIHVKEASTITQVHMSIIVVVCWIEFFVEFGHSVSLGVPIYCRTWKLVKILANSSQVWVYFASSDHIDEINLSTNYGFLTPLKSVRYKVIYVLSYWTKKCTNVKLRLKIQETKMCK